MEKLGKKLKHDHTLTSILKFTIFAMVMLAPIFSVASRCLYVICNKNAKDSYSGTSGYGIQYAYETNDVETTNDLIEGNIYYFELKVNYTSENINYFYAHNIYNFETRYGDLIVDEFSTNGWILLQETVNFFKIECSGQSYNMKGDKTENIGNKIRFVYASNFNDTYINQVSRCDDIPIASVDLDNSGSLDNAFEYSLSQLEESSYYNWATNLGIYTPIHNMVSGLGGHDIIALLLAYWSIYTAIYIVFDIIIVCFVKITHMIQGE